MIDATHYDPEPITAFDWVRKHQCPIIRKCLDPDRVSSTVIALDRWIKEDAFEVSVCGPLGDSNITVHLSNYESVETFDGQRIPPMTPSIQIYFLKEPSGMKQEYEDLKDFSEDMMLHRMHRMYFPIDERLWLLPYLFRLQQVRLRMFSNMQTIMYDVPQHHKRALALNMLQRPLQTHRTILRAA